MNNITIPYINPYISIITKNDRIKAVSINGKIKKLQCDKIFFDTILASIDGKTPLSNIISHHAQTYSTSTIEHFLDILIQAENLLDRNKLNKNYLQSEKEELSEHPPLLVIVLLHLL